MPGPVAPPKALPASKPVKLRPEWASIIEAAKAQPHHNTRVWTAEEDAFLIGGREAGLSWGKIAETIGCDLRVARKRWASISGQAPK